MIITLISTNIIVSLSLYIYIYIYIYTHTNTPRRLPAHSLQTLIHGFVTVWFEFLKQSYIINGQQTHLSYISGFIINYMIYTITVIVY